MSLAVRYLPKRLIDTIVTHRSDWVTILTMLVTKPNISYYLSESKSQNNEIEHNRFHQPIDAGMKFTVRQYNIISVTA
jgi:hypothetical protein